MMKFMHFRWFNFTHHKFVQYDQRGFSLPLMLLGILLLIGTGAGAFYFSAQFSQKPQAPYPALSPTPKPTIIPKYTSSPNPSNNTTISEITINLASLGKTLTYINRVAGYELRYWDSYKLLENEKVSVDGVKIPAENTISVVSPFISELNTNLVMSIKYIAYSKSFPEFITQESNCESISYEKGQIFTIDNKKIAYFEDTNCNPFNSTFIFTLVDNIGYIIEITSSARFSEIKNYIQTIPDFWLLNSKESKVEWDTALRLLNAGFVRTGIQSHSKIVDLNLFNGIQVITVEPNIDEIFKVIKNCNQCGYLRFATE